ncbi:MAG TPA: sigma-54 dependent transcriptional regulator [Polyangiales bacterium]|nr:sigma-54 dependent transcriptional regulator [Polyangiales bacterium]
MSGAQNSLLLIDDSDDVLTTISKFLNASGYRTALARSRSEGVQRLDELAPDLCVVDYELPDGNAFDVLNEIRHREARPAVIVLTGHGSIELAVEAIKQGADHFLTKPVDLPSLGILVERLLRSRAQLRRGSASERNEERARVDPFVGSSAAIREVRTAANAVARSDVALLLTGETGTGKGVLARWLHEQSARSDEAFVDLNCAGLNRELTESELFGHQRGSFTSAHAAKRGLLELAHHGTLFMDEIGDLELSVQPKLLKALEDRSFRRLGDVQTRSADFRLISATHRDLAEMSRNGSFRADLLFRINTVTIALPALRDRREDIAPLAQLVLEQLCRQHGRSLPHFTPAALKALEGHAWPGNVRELRNVIERALIFCRGDSIEPQLLAIAPQPAAPGPAASSVLKLKDVERDHVLAVLQRVDGRVEDAAKLLGVGRSALYARLKRYGVRDFS